MKHNLKVIYILTVVFFVTQIIGLMIINQYIDKGVLADEGEIEFAELPFEIERPPLDEGSSFWYIGAAILIGTALLLIIIKFGKARIWKIWYLLSVVITLTVAFAAFMWQKAALGLAILAGYFKVFRPNMWLHNLTELFIYGGLAAIFVPVMNVFSAFMLLILISLYDMYAVWKSKHMISMAKFTTENKVFAGLAIPYEKSSGKIKGKIPSKLAPGKGKVKNAILGGGDIGFPLLFAGAVMKVLMVENTFWIGFLKTLFIPLFTSVALFILFMKGENNKFYPAMPFLSLGCIMGYGAVMLVNLL